MSQTNNKDSIKFIDLFSGLGGTRIGLEQACSDLDLNSECVLSSDKKKSAAQAYKENFDEEVFPDVVKIDEEKLNDFDFLLAGFPCFTAKVKILTKRGNVPITDVVVGDEVLTHRNRWRKVIRTGSTKHARTILLRGMGAEVECTPNHPFLSCETVSGSEYGTLSEAAWTAAQDMHGKMWLVSSKVFPLPFGGDPFSDERGWWRQVYDCLPGKEDVTVYNIEVEEDHSYVANGIFVHNCQPFSRAGMKRGFSDTRGTMFFEIERILAAKKPKYVLLENVAELVTNDKGQTLPVIIDHLEKLGYATSWKVLNGNDFGLAQSRKRIYIAGILNSDPLDFDSLGGKDSSKTMKDIMETGLLALETDFTKAVLDHYAAEDIAGYVISDKRRGDKTFHSWDIEMNGSVSADGKKLMEAILSEFRKRKWADQLGVKWRDGMPLNFDQLTEITGWDANRLKSTLDDLTSKKYLIQKHPYEDDFLIEREDLPIGWRLNTARLAFELNRFLGPDDVCVTLTATDASHIGIIDGDGLRRLSMRECLRLFGFPDSYDLSFLNEHAIYDLVGNSICVPVVKEICKAMLTTGLDTQNQ